MDFKDQLKIAIEEGKKNKEIRDKGGKPIIPKVSLTDKIKGLTGAFKRIKEKGGLNTIWADENEIKERVVCCTTCTDGNNCPYCGCQINKSWYLPLGKSDLSTEGCPNPQTYPHLKSFPPRNFWEVCKEVTTVLIPVGPNEKPDNYNRTIESLIENSTGKIEILVLTDGWEPDNVYQSDMVKVLPSKENLGERKTVNRGFREARGKYVFRVDAHCSMSYGWDTKLKCSCNDNNLVVCVLDAIDEKTWKSLNHCYTFVYISTECEEKWLGDYKRIEDCQLVEKTMSLTGCGWMATKDFYWNLFGGFDESLGKWGCIGPEMSIKIYSKGGEIVLRKDVVCGHLFNSNALGYPGDVVKKTQTYLLSKYKNELLDIVKMFAPVPGWEILEKKCFRKTFDYPNHNGKIVRKIIKEYAEEKDIPDKIYDNRFENDKWNNQIISNENDIQLWLFENEA